MMERIPGVSQGQGLVLVGEETRGGLHGDLIIDEFHMDVTRVDRDHGKRDQRHWIVSGRLNERYIFFSCPSRRGRQCIFVSAKSEKTEKTGRKKQRVREKYRSLD